jgi:hypothetical protein
MHANSTHNRTCSNKASETDKYRSTALLASKINCFKHTQLRYVYACVIGLDVQPGMLDVQPGMLCGAHFLCSTSFKGGSFIHHTTPPGLLLAAGYCRNSTQQTSPTTSDTTLLPCPGIP